MNSALARCAGTATATTTESNSLTISYAGRLGGFPLQGVDSCAPIRPVHGTAIWLPPWAPDSATDVCQLHCHEAGSTDEKVSSQIRGGFAGVKGADAALAIVAYEPIWAIGTGLTATPAAAQNRYSYGGGYSGYYDNGYNDRYRDQRYDRDNYRDNDRRREEWRREEWRRHHRHHEWREHYWHDQNWGDNDRRGDWRRRG